MMPPRRQTGKDLPANLYPSPDKRTGVVYYRWKNPATKQWHGLGSDKVRAVKDAKTLNAVVLSGMAQSRIEYIATPVPDTPKFSAVLLRHTELCELKHSRGKLAYNTMKSKRSHGKALRDKVERLGKAGLGGAGWLRDRIERAKEKTDD